MKFKDQKFQIHVLRIKGHFGISTFRCRTTFSVKCFVEHEKGFLNLDGVQGFTNQLVYLQGKISFYDILRFKFIIFG